jgi:hypothetical protein
MKTKIHKIVIAILFVTSSFSFGQKISTEIWTENEKNQYSKLIELANYVYKKEKIEISKDSLFKKYIYFDYVLSDTVSARKEKRLVTFDTIFYPFRKNLDSLGIKSLDAKPVRFYKNHKIYEPFKEEIAKETISGEKMFTKDSNVFAYYKKEDPENPLGTLLFESKTNKLVSWIMINQGGYKYFLTFNLFGNVSDSRKTSIK